jgi:hypothetical protein
MKYKSLEEKNYIKTTNKNNDKNILFIKDLT